MLNRQGSLGCFSNLTSYCDNYSSLGSGSEALPSGFNYSGALFSPWIFEAWNRTAFPTTTSGMQRTSVTEFLSDSGVHLSRTLVLALANSMPSDLSLRTWNQWIFCSYVIDPFKNSHFSQSSIFPLSSARTTEAFPCDFVLTIVSSSLPKSILAANFPLCVQSVFPPYQLHDATSHLLLALNPGHSPASHQKRLGITDCLVE